MTISERIDALRKSKGYSQAQLARAIQVAPSTMHTYLHDVQSATGMSGDVAVRLARVLGVSVEYLYGVYDDTALQQ